MRKSQIDSITRMQIQEFVDQLASNCTIEETPEGGYLIRPTEETLENTPVFIRIYEQVKQRGALGHSC
jgi:hypothetical protein